MRFFLCTSIIALLGLVSYMPQSMACTFPPCAATATMLGNGRVSSATPVLVFATTHCTGISEYDILDEIPNYDIGLTASTVTLRRLDTNGVVNVTVSESPQRPNVYHVLPEHLDSGVQYTVELDLPARVHFGAQRWSTTFTATSLAKPSGELSLDVEVSTPEWKTYKYESGEHSDCSPYHYYTYDERTIKGRVPVALTPWAHLLVWRVRVDGQWKASTPYLIQGHQEELLRDPCNKTNKHIERSYMFEAYLPGSQLSWRSAEKTVSITCPPRPQASGDMSPDMDMTRLDMHTMDMGAEMPHIDIDHVDMEQEEMFCDTTPDMNNHTDTDKPTPNKAAGSGSEGCTQLSTSVPSPGALTLFMFMFFGIILRKIRRTPAV